MRTNAWRLVWNILALLGILILTLLYPAIDYYRVSMHIHWENRWALFLLIAVPWILMRVTVGMDKRVPTFRFPALALVARVSPGWRANLRDLPGILRTGALFLAVIALARPQDIARGEHADEQGIDMVVLLDLSGSMRAVMDGEGGNWNVGVNPGQRVTRLDTAKEVINDFIRRRRSDRIGVVVFGRSAYVLSPPTLDYQLLTTLVQRMELEMIDGNGTAIGDAIGVGVARLRRGNARSKVLIVLTDGDSNAGMISPEYASQLAQIQGVKIYTIQIGTGDEVEVQNGVDLFGQPHYVRAHFPVNPALLNSIASQTGGESFIAADRQGLENSMHAILDRLEKTRFSSQTATVKDLFMIFLAPAGFMIMAEVILRLTLVRRFP
ncbi:vWA domain-containing protein [Pajaroellobacter abortibovis]|uniref:VWFA domain-containing protein n=1 Tax=Pajaroellobacter abortibovis TaxID=1882918 RepID=A0A1L6MWF0_9BACT|nr:VWA domain-containing protein [Pajaroellobacter abortibovis]APR99737.1 hypothetical protein BCY86_02895 [Pajaroellobacter abortibovis]